MTIMLRTLALLLIGAAFGGGVGFVLAPSDRAGAEATPAMDHSMHMHAHGEALVLPEGGDAPTLEIAVTPDPVAGWNLNIMVENFRFAATRAGEAHVPGEGHAHIYVNGKKLARAYGDWFHLETLPVGLVEVEVTLNANDHRALMVGDLPLSAVVSFENRP